MAFDFLGTLSLEQLREFRSFIEEEVESIDDAINTLRVELDNTKRTRIDFSIADDNFGGDVAETVSDTKLEEDSNIPLINDSNSRDLMVKIKRSFISNIKYKRERIEFKYKKLTDRIDNLKEEIDRKAIAKTQAIELLNELEQLFTEENKTHLFKTTNDLENYRKGVI